MDRDELLAACDSGHEYEVHVTREGMGGGWIVNLYAAGDDPETEDPATGVGYGDRQDAEDMAASVRLALARSPQEEAGDGSVPFSDLKHVWACIGLVRGELGDDHHASLAAEQLAALARSPGGTERETWREVSCGVHTERHHPEIMKHGYCQGDPVASIAEAIAKEVIRKELESVKYDIRMLRERVEGRKPW